jgi:hypothetical protein
MFASIYTDEKLVLMPARARENPFWSGTFSTLSYHDVSRRAGGKREVAQTLGFGDRRRGKVPARIEFDCFSVCPWQPFVSNKHSWQ